jgi:hypothetical protein
MSALTIILEPSMGRNMGTVDRAIRACLAAGVAILYFTGVISGFTALGLSILAVIFVFTSAMSFCPLYVPFKIRTTEKS